MILKRVVSILFCLLLCLSQVGFYIGFLLEQHKTKDLIHKQVIARAPLHLLERIVQQDAIQWEDDNKEFYLHGSLYDVVKIQVENGKTVFYCINDENEEQLLKNLSVVAGSDYNHSSNKNNHYQYKKLVFDEFYSFNNAIEFNSIIKVINSLSVIRLYFPSSYLTVDLPPPRV